MYKIEDKYLVLLASLQKKIARSIILLICGNDSTNETHMNKITLENKQNTNENDNRIEKIRRVCIIIRKRWNGSKG